jgi:pimeloyl-[acyl-carrier protein] methyl ester esterase
MTDAAQVVLLHGWGVGGGVFAPLAAALADRARVSIPDLPGYGATPPCNEPTLGAFAASVRPRIPPGSVLLGWSLGALVALRIALDCPERVARLVLVSGTPRFSRDATWAHGMEPGLLAAFADGLACDPGGTQRRFLGEQVLGADRGRTTLAALRSHLAGPAHVDRASLRAGLDVLATADLRDAVGALACPLLLLHGTRDRLVPAAAGAWLADRIPRSRFEPVEGAGHAPFVSHADAVLAALRGFLP